MKNRRHFLWIFLLLVPLLWLVWPSGDKSGRELGARSVSDVGSRLTGGPRTREELSGRMSRRPSGSDSADPAEVDRILADDSISHQKAAAQLRKLAMDSTRSTEDRLEALEHGLNLNAAVFADFAQQKGLPTELATHYLHEMINHNDSPALQIRAYVALMDHPDAEVAGLAKEMLALAVDNEEDEPSREKLLMGANSKLAALATESGQ